MAVTALLFALLFTVLPDVTIAWRDVWFGARATSALFTLGKFAIGAYLGHSAMASSYGVAGSFVVLVVWTYYSSQIVFFGAEFMQAYAKHRGAEIVPSAIAARVPAVRQRPDGRHDRPSGFFAAKILGLGDSQSTAPPCEGMGSSRMRLRGA